MNRLKQYMRPLIDWTSSVPLWAWAIVGLVAVFLPAIIPASSSSSEVVPPDMLASIRSEIEGANGSILLVNQSVQSQTTALGEIKDLLTEIRDGRSGRRRTPAGDPRSVQLTLPSGETIDELSLASQATGRFTVANGRYRESLISHGFDASQLPDDDGSCRAIYDGWKSSRSPAVSQSAPAYQCDGKRCWRVR
jgi:hypothetical protein